MEEKVIEILRDVLGDESVDINTSQQNNPKWDSMAQLNLIVELESSFDLSFEPEEIATMNSVLRVIETIKGKTKRYD